MSKPVQPRAIMFILTGTEPSVGLIKDLSGMIAANCNVAVDTNGEFTDSVECFQFNEDEMASAVAGAILLHAMTGGEPLQHAAHQEEEKTPEEQAVIYVGTVMKDELSKPWEPEEFIAALTQKIREARIADNDESRRFMDALFILSQEDLIVSRGLLKKYKLNEKKILLIKRIYNLLVGSY